MGALAGHILTFIKTLITIYDTLTSWAYKLIQRQVYYFINLTLKIIIYWGII